MNISHTSCLQFCCLFTDHKCLAAVICSAGMVFFSFMASRGKHSVGCDLGSHYNPGVSSVLSAAHNAGLSAIRNKVPGQEESEWSGG